MSEAIAHHEAGHAVVGRVLGIEVTYVTVFDYSAGGECQYEPFPHDRDLAARLWRAETDAIFTLAGPLAECRYLWPNQPSKGAIAGWLRSGDRKAARRCIARLARLKRNILTPMFPTPKYDELFDQLCDRTWAMVGDHWPAIERVAHALLEWSDLNGAYVDDLIGRP